MRKILVALVAVLGLLPAVVSGADAGRLNVVFILIDDLGWRDLGYAGSQFYESPAIDKLAAEGMVFTRAYEAAPRCVPSRTSIMTGKDHNRPELDGEHGVPLEEITVAEAFKEQGYRTFFAGKWHLGMEGYWPQNQGFDINKGGCGLGALTTHFWPYMVPGKKEAGGTQKESKNVVPFGLEKGKPGEFISDRLTDEAVAFLKEHKSAGSKQPFFLYLSHYMVHQPLEAKPELVKYFEQKLKRMPKQEGPDFELDYTGKVKLKQDLPVYAAMIKSADESVARVRQALAELGYADNTAVIFTSDNGGLSTCDRLGTRGVSTSNKPLRTGKGWLYEGGMRVPLIVHWPGVTKASTKTDRAVTGTDFYPTMLEMAGLPLKPKQHLDGESFAAVLKGDLSHPRKPIFWYYDGAKVETGNVAMAAMLDGDKKLVHFVHEDKVELYNLRDDIGEHRDLATGNPETVKSMKTALLNWEKSVGVKHLKSHHVSEIQALLAELEGEKPKSKKERKKSKNTQ